MQIMYIRNSIADKILKAQCVEVGENYGMSLKFSSVLLTGQDKEAWITYIFFFPGVTHFTLIPLQYMHARVVYKI